MTDLTTEQRETVARFGLDSIDDLEVLRALTKAAMVPNGPSVWWGETDVRERLDHPDAVVDAPFIAACSPAVVLELIARLDAVAGVVDRLREQAEQASARVVELDLLRRGRGWLTSGEQTDREQADARAGAYGAAVLILLAVTS